VERRESGREKVVISGEEGERKGEGGDKWRGER
jgi:hypothetical protein